MLCRLWRWGGRALGPIFCVVGRVSPATRVAVSIFFMAFLPSTVAGREAAEGRESTKVNPAPAPACAATCSDTLAGLGTVLAGQMPGPDMTVSGLAKAVSTKAALEEASCPRGTGGPQSAGLVLDRLARDGVLPLPNGATESSRGGVVPSVHAKGRKPLTSHHKRAEMEPGGGDSGADGVPSDAVDGRALGA